MAERYPNQVVISIKRLMGRRFRDDAVQDTLRRVHFLCNVTTSHQRERIEVALANKHLTPQEISSKILQKLKADAEAYLGHEVRQAVITVPAYFHDPQRQATRDAGRIAGLEVLRVLNEPTAACLAFGYKKLAEARKKIAVYDLGGGTFDISLLEVGRGPFSVRAVNGNTYLGGDDLDWLIVEWVLEQMDHAERQRIHEHIGHMNPQQIPNEIVVALARLRRAAERAKIALSSVEETRVQVEAEPGSPFSTPDLTLTRSTFERIAKTFINRTLEPCYQALQDAGLGAANIEEVVLVGGQTRMPMIRQAVQTFFGREPDTSVNPEEIVGMGAAIRAAMLAGETTGIKLVDVVPLSLGVKTEGGKMERLIERNSRVPTGKKNKPFTTAYDNQESVEVQIYQGESPMVSDNVKLGSFTLVGIEPAKAGEPEIDVTFSVEEDGILFVTGRDCQADKVKEIKITDSVRLEEGDIEEMIRDAEAHAEEYAAQQKQTEAQEQVRSLTERLKQIEQEGALPDDLASDIREVLQLPEPEDWVARLERLHALWQREGERG
jgi:molecular chaperone DnaK